MPGNKTNLSCLPEDLLRIYLWDDLLQVIAFYGHSFRDCFPILVRIQWWAVSSA